MFNVPKQNKNVFLHHILQYFQRFRKSIPIEFRWFESEGHSRF